MFRILSVSAVALAGIMTLNAGQIQLGGANGLTSGTVTFSTTGSGADGLLGYNAATFQSVSTITGGTGNLCKGPALPNPCAAGNVVAVPTAVPNGETTGSGEYATANGVTFSMINQGDGVSNAWVASNTGTSTFTIPVGIFGVDSAWTMLNDEYGVSGQSPTTVTFNFGTTASNANAGSITFTLVNGTVIRDSLQCTTNTTNCSQYATSLDTTHMFSTTGASLGAITTTAVPNVTAFNVWSGSYTGGTGNYSGTTGNAYLDAQKFSLGTAYMSDYLVNIVITDASGSTAKVSRDTLSAITIDPAPEPSSVFLLVAGLAVMGYFSYRRRTV